MSLTNLFFKTTVSNSLNKLSILNRVNIPIRNSFKLQSECINFKKNQLSNYTSTSLLKRNCFYFI